MGECAGRVRGWGWVGVGVGVYWGSGAGERGVVQGEKMPGWDLGEHSCRRWALLYMPPGGFSDRGIYKDEEE